MLRQLRRDRVRSWAVRAACVLVAALANAGPAQAANRHAALLNAARASISHGELREHAAALADDAFEGREAGSRGGRAAARYLENQLAETGLEPAGADGGFIQRFNGNMRNLLAKIPGADPQLAAEVVLIGAHYDHVGYGSPQNSYGPWGYIHNGADDNASGVAALLEVIEAFQTVDYRPRRTIVFAFWDGEEKNLLGSKHWVAHPTVPLDVVKLAVNVDMIGRMKNGKLTVGGTRTGVGLRRLLSTRELPQGIWLDFTWEYKPNSDHWPLFERGVPSIYLHTGFHDDYHRPSDDVERLNIEGIWQASDYLTSLAARIAEVDRLPKFRDAARSDTPQRRRAVEAPLPPASHPGRLGLAWRADPVEPEAVFITRVDPRTPAARAGLLVHDRIYALDDQPVDNSSSLLAAIREKLAADVDQCRFTVERRGRISDALVRFKPAPPDAAL